MQKLTLFVDLGGFVPRKINESGIIAGSCPDARACVWSRGAVRAIDGPNSFASGINNRGDVVGGRFDENGPLNAFIVDRKGRLTDLGSAGVADDINDKGVISGWERGIDSSAAASVEGVLLSLGGEPSTTSGVNASGWVLVNGEGFASVRNPLKRVRVSLAPEGAADAVDINDHGDIVGVADGGDGMPHIVIWRLRGANPPR